MSDIIQDIVVEGCNLSRQYAEMAGVDVEPGREVFYTAYAMTSRGREEIEVYGSADEAIRDILDLWPEEDEGDVIIEDNRGDGVAYFARSDNDPRIVHVFRLAPSGSPFVIDGVDSYRCEHEPALGGSVRTIVTKLG